MGTTVLCEITLMIFFRAIEGGRGLNLCHDRLAKAPAAVESLLFRFRRRFLFRRMIKNDRPILRTDIGALAIPGRRVVIAPENIEQLLVGHLRGFELYFDHFRVTGLVTANFLVGRVLCRTAGVAARRRGHAFVLRNNSSTPQNIPRRKSPSRYSWVTIKREGSWRNRLCLTNASSCSGLTLVGRDSVEPEEVSRRLEGVSPYRSTGCSAGQLAQLFDPDQLAGAFPAVGAGK